MNARNRLCLTAALALAGLLAHRPASAAEIDPLAGSQDSGETGVGRAVYADHGNAQGRREMGEAGIHSEDDARPCEELRRVTQ